MTKEEFHAAELDEQRHQYRDLDADSACCPEGFECIACPPNLSDDEWKEEF